MNNILEDEPILPTPNHKFPDHASIFASLKTKALEARMAKNIPVIRAQAETLERDVFEDLTKRKSKFKNGTGNAANGDGKKKDLRELISKLKLEQSLRSDGSADSFYSSSSKSSTVSCNNPTSLAEARDFVQALVKEDISGDEKHKIADKLLELPIRNDRKLAEGVVVVGKKFVEFFGDILERVENSPNSRIHNFISTKMNEFDLYQELVLLLADPSIHSDALNKIAKVIYVTTIRSKVFDICQLAGFRPQIFIESMISLGTKYSNLLAVAFVRYVYDFKHDLDKTVNDTDQDRQYCEFLIEKLKENASSEHAIMGLYFIMNRMPMPNLNSLYDAQNLGALLDKVIRTHEEDENEEAGIVALKIKQFPIVGNYLAEKVERSNVMNQGHRGALSRQKRHFSNNIHKGENPHSSDLIPLANTNYSGKASYRGVLRSITDLRKPQPYQILENQGISDKVEEFIAKEPKVTEFGYGKILDHSNIERQGFCLKVVKDTNDKFEVARLICHLLNNAREFAGILLIGVVSNGHISIVEGVAMSRQERDAFRIGLDNLLRDIIIPMPSYDRFEPPIFHPVTNHVRREESFVIRLIINPCQNENEVPYALKSSVLLKS